MADGVGPIVGAGLGLIAGLAVAKVGLEMVKETGQMAKQSQPKMKMQPRQPVNDTQRRINYMLGK